MSKYKQASGSVQDMPSLCLCACVSVTHFLNECVCASVLMYVLHKAATTSGGGRDTSKLNGTGALRGLRDNTGLTDPTKWPIMSQWRNLGRKKIPNPTTVIPLEQWTHKHTHWGEGEGIRLALELCKDLRWNGGFFS